MKTESYFKNYNLLVDFHLTRIQIENGLIKIYWNYIENKTQKLGVFLYDEKNDRIRQYACEKAKLTQKQRAKLLDKIHRIIEIEEKLYQLRLD